MTFTFMFTWIHELSGAMIYRGRVETLILIYGSSLLTVILTVSVHVTT